MQGRHTGGHNGGRPKGSKNKRTELAQDFLAKVLSDRVEKRSWQRFLNSGDEKTAFEAFKLAVQYKRGCPPKSLEVSGGGEPLQVELVIRQIGVNGLPPERRA